MATGPVFERDHHRRIAQALSSLDAELLQSLACWFGGGTAIALRQGEYRESVDIDFLVSDVAGYRDLRQRLRGAVDLRALTCAGQHPIPLENEPRIDQYGIRTFLLMGDARIKFEIVHEGRILLSPPGRNDRICGVAALSAIDLGASKLLANADRRADDSTFSRDAIDLAMLDLPPRDLRAALGKAAGAYGPTVADDMHAALDSLRDRPGRLHRCMDALSITLPPAFIQQKLRHLSRRMKLASAGAA